MKKLIVLTIILISFALIFGCTETEEKENGDFETPAPIDEPTDGEITWEENISKLLKSPNYKIIYSAQIDSEYIGEIDYTLTQYILNQNIRSDFSLMGMDSKIFLIDEEIITCDQMFEEWNCIKMMGSDIELFNDDLRDIRKNPNNYKEKISITTTKTILDQKTTCYEVKTINSTTTYCLNEIGIPLLINGVNELGEFSFIATEFSIVISENDFILPAEIY